MRFRHATGVFLILIANALPALGQGRPGPVRVSYGIAGTVRDDSDQHTMESVRVDLKQATGTPINSTFTRGSGEFEFAGIPGAPADRTCAAIGKLAAIISAATTTITWTIRFQFTNPSSS